MYRFEQISDIHPARFDLPPRLKNTLFQYAWNQQTIGCSGANVFRLEADGRSPLFLKTEQISAFSELANEAQRLEWLAGQGVSCPRVLAFEVNDGWGWLLMTAIPGSDLALSPDMVPACLIEIAACALRNLHKLDVGACPFNHTLDQSIGLARARVEAGVVDEADFDDERQGRTGAELYADLLANRLDSEDIVVAHGDACLPNLMAAENRFTGFVDCGRLGVADRCQDLALACRSIRHNFGEDWVQPFLTLYGLPEVSPSRLGYYQLLDEFF